jgi:flagellar basal-body rod protein FlgB
MSDLFDLIAQKMSYLYQKQAVLAENVANVDTPNYKQLDVKPFSFEDALHSHDIGMTVTDPNHIIPASMAGVNAKTFASKDTEVLPSGNSVDIEGQMMEVSKTSMDYQKLISVYHKMSSLINIAIKGSSSV